MPIFRPPADWEAVYAGTEGYFFGEEPSQIARTALRRLSAFGGGPSPLFQPLALDLGSGEGRDTAFLAQAGLCVVAHDVSPAGLDKTRALLARRGLPLDRVDLAREDVRDFAYPLETYDLAMAANVFQFLGPEDAPLHVERLKRCTRPGGICAVGVFSSAMLGWGAELGDAFTASPDDLLAFFPRSGGWLPLDRTEYWTYGIRDGAMASFAFVVARKNPAEEAA